MADWNKDDRNKNDWNNKGFLIGGIISSVITLGLIAFRIVCVSELGRLQSGSKDLIHIGFKRMSEKDYYGYIENLVNKSFLAITSFVLLTVVLLSYCVIVTRNTKEQEDNQIDTHTDERAV